MKTPVTILGAILLLSLLIAGCTKSTEPEETPTLYEAQLTIVALTQDDFGNPYGMEGVPIVVREHHQAGSGPYNRDTIYTNESGIGYYSQKITCWAYDGTGKITIMTPGETKVVYFKNEEDIDVILTVPQIQKH